MSIIVVTYYTVSITKSSIYLGPEEVPFPSLKVLIRTSTTMFVMQGMKHYNYTALLMALYFTSLETRLLNIAEVMILQ